VPAPTSPAHPRLLAVWSLAALLGACGHGEASGSASGGTVEVAIVPSVRLASGPGVVGARLTVSPGSGPAFAPFTVELPPGGGQLAASLTGIPAGSGRQIAAEGYDAEGVLAARGATGVDVLEGAATSLIIVMNELPDSTAACAPIIDQLALTRSTVPPLGTVDLAVSAHAADGSAVALGWTASCGRFATDPVAAAVTWLAPAAPGSCAVSVTATGAGGSAVTASLQIAVGP
jgi:hypothetical protein